MRTTKKAHPQFGIPSIEAPSAQKPVEKPDSGFPVVGVGASAGGLAAFEAFFAGMPADTDPGMAFVLVQHLSPDHKSILSELIKRYTRMAVLEVEDGMVVQPNHAYIIPPNHDMFLQDGTLRLLEQPAPRGLRLPIDFFFRSLAQDQRHRAICVVLSGTGSDGTQGVRAIKGEGGMAMAQDPDSTEYDGMPRSAITTGLVDYILQPADMPAQLIAYVAHAFGTPGTANLMEPGQDANLLRRVLALLRTQTGHDFSQYKHNTIARRVARRMAVHQVREMADYLRYLERTPAEVEALFRDLLIGVTSFFRDTEAFGTLQKEAIPRLVADKPAGGAIRAWVPGCSTGEEAYSIAMLLQENVEPLNRGIKIQVFATDIDRQAIEQARAGVYSGSIATDVSPERLERFFVRAANSGDFRVRKSLRDLLVFSEQDVVRDPPLSNLDLISCRNVLIYMEAPLQKRLVPLFHYALRPEGFLFLGISESVGEFPSLFSTFDRKAKLYQSRQTDRRAYPPTLGKQPIDATTRAEGHRPPVQTPVTARSPLRELTESALLQQYDPVAVLVDEHGQILYLHGRTGLYLEPAPGEADMRIQKMAREGLRRELTGALNHAAVHNEMARREGLRVRTNGDFTTVNLTVRPVSSKADSTPTASLFLVIFEQAEATPEEHLQEVPRQGSATSAETPVVDLDARIAALQQELRTREEYLQTINEELETANEELQSSNEELQSVNEELQSTVEELETSKEELQAVNEELATINAELQAKVGDLVRANNDINNLLAGTGIGTIFVDHQLRILRFTPTITDVINLIPGDVGRAVGHIVTNLVGYDQLSADAQEVLRTLIPKEVEVRTQAGTWYMLRIHPYRTQENVIEGAVLNFFDISELKQMQEKLRESGMEMQALVSRLDVAREEERAAVAWELHDEIAQALAIVRDTLHEWSGKSKAEVSASGHTSLEETMKLLDAAIERLRGLYTNLVPVMLEDLDLASTIQWQVEEFAFRSQLSCRTGRVDPVELDTRTSLGLFRVLQEVLENAAQHPGTTSVTVDLVREGDYALLRVTDDGRAMSGENCMKPGTPRLVSIRARAHSWRGSVKLRTTDDGSTVIEITAPLRLDAT